MQDDTTQTDATDPKGQAEPQQDEATADTSTEEQQPQSEDTPTEGTEETPQETPEPEAESEESDSVNIEDYWKERYSPQNSQEPLKEESQDLMQRLGTLPTDEYGNANAEDVGKVIQEWQRETETNSVSKATQTARQEALALFNEQNQLQQVIKDYPQVTKNRELMDTIFDLRDASALRGEDISLKTAAEKWFNREKDIRKDATTQATRTKEIQASAHLETSGIKSDTQDSKQQLAAQAVGNSPEANAARRALLTDAVQKMLDDGELQA